MKRFHPTKTITRAVTIPSSDRAIAAAKWVLEISGSGVRFHRLHQRGESWGLSWRSVIAHALVHNQQVRCNGVGGRR